jgi:hypothetical protein
VADEPSPAEEARLRRLLARSRHDERLPEDIAEHLDAVLARLDAGEDVGGPVAEVHALAAARRRRAVSLLIAAAAVVVVGIGLGQVVDGLGTGGGGDTAASETSSQEEAIAADRSVGRGEVDGDEAGGRAELPEGTLDSQSSSAFSSDVLGAQVALGDLIVVDGRLVDVPAEGFTRAAARVQRQVVPAAGGQGRRTKPLLLSAAPARVRRGWEGCAPVDFGEGTAVAVVYEGDPAILVFRPPTGSSQVVELLQCGTGATQRSVTLPAR